MANGYAHLTRKTQCHFAKHSITRKKKQETNKQTRTNKKPAWHNLVLREPGTFELSNGESSFPQGYPGSNPGAGVHSFFQLFHQ